MRYTLRRLDRAFRRFGSNMTQNQVNKDFMRLRPRCISIGQLKGRYPLTLPTYQTGSLPDTLLTYVMGYLISRPASRLDAFSGYPIRTWLPGLCSWRNNRYTSGSSIPVLSYYGQILSNILRPQWIGTELSHDVLNPAHVPL